MTLDTSGPHMVLLVSMSKQYVIKVRVSAKEKREIERAAKECSRSVSSFLRVLALNNNAKQESK